RRGPAPVEAVPLVGRERELAILAQLWEDMLTERSRVLVLKGRAGTGKTRLGQSLLLRARGRGQGAFFTACHPGDPTPFSSVRRLIDDHVGERLRAGGEEARANLRAIAGDLSPLLKVVSPLLARVFEDAPPVPASQDAEHIFAEGIAEFLAKL